MLAETDLNHSRFLYFFGKWIQIDQEGDGQPHAVVDFGGRNAFFSFDAAAYPLEGLLSEDAPSSHGIYVQRRRNTSVLAPRD